MQKDAKNFVAQWLRTVLMAFLPVALTAFVTIPWNLQRMPGEPLARVAAGERHMT